MDVVRVSWSFGLSKIWSDQRFGRRFPSTKDKTKHMTKDKADDVRYFCSI